MKKGGLEGFVLFQPKHILHVIHARLIFFQETRRTQRTQRERGAAADLVSDLDALAGTREQYRVVADDVAATHGGKAYRRGIALAGDTFAAIHRALREIAPQGFRNHFRSEEHT